MYSYEQDRMKGVPDTGKGIFGIIRRLLHATLLDRLKGLSHEMDSAFEK
jgi:hypothetical protein